MFSSCGLQRYIIVDDNAIHFFNDANFYAADLIEMSHRSVAPWKRGMSEFTLKAAFSNDKDIIKAICRTNAPGQFELHSRLFRHVFVYRTENDPLCDSDRDRSF